MSFLKKLAGETALYGISSILGRVLNFLLVPLYVRTLPSEEYGEVTYFYAFAAFFNVLYTFGLETTYFRFANKDLKQEPRIFHQTFTSVAFIGLLFSVSLIWAAHPLAEWTDYSQAVSIIRWLAIIFLVDAIVAIPFARLRLQGKAKAFAAIRLINVAVNIGLNLFFLVLCPYVDENGGVLQPLVSLVYRPDYGVEYIFISNLIANLLYLPLLGRTLMQVRIHWNWQDIKPQLVYAYPLVIMMLAGVTNEMLSRIMLNHYLPEDFYDTLTRKQAVGVFGACYKLSVFMNLGIQAFRYAAEPFFFSRQQSADSKQEFGMIMDWFMVVGVLVFVGISLHLEWLGPLVLGKAEYLEGLNVVPVLLLASLFLGIYFNLSIWFKLSDKNQFGTAISLGGALLTVVLNAYLIPLKGFEGSAWVTLVVYVLMSLACYGFGQRYYPIPYNMLFLGLVLLLGVGIVLVFQQFAISNWFLRTAVNSLGILLFLLGVWILRKLKLGLRALSA
ncbi:oligosaccharide flippase family protein [Cytophagales bacterium LB-30]|uniref:Oligosaccharide flippase family protein n=1 Tax=Shiella aurantiaca TaxID=3058365 RepID=A0ABT8F2K3_9BACT|nr:oligosaccharide flippase family protein [Shiella aurantiaca]MDN4164682.1 oligosaccharide flippase family protein [Shiella aurantiaca]